MSTLPQDWHLITITEGVDQNFLRRRRENKGKRKIVFKNCLKCMKTFFFFIFIFFKRDFLKIFIYNKTSKKLDIKERSH